MCSYKKLGLKSKLNAAAGGAEKDFSKPAEHPDELSTPTTDLEVHRKQPKLGANEARIERDEDGNVVRIVYGKAAGEDDDDDEEAEDEEGEFHGFEEEEPKTEVVKVLEKMAANAAPAVGRDQSDREQDWISLLVQKHGDDYEAMKWDKKLNVFQQSAGDLKKRVKKWKKEQEKLRR